MNKDTTTGPKNVDFYQVPEELWQVAQQFLPPEPERRGRGRSRVDNRAALNGIGYVLRTGCRWKAIHRHWLGVSSSVLYERFQTWQSRGVFQQMMQAMAGFYQTERTITIGWEWPAIDSKMASAPLHRIGP